MSDLDSGLAASTNAAPSIAPAAPAPAPSGAAVAAAPAAAPAAPAAPAGPTSMSEALAQAGWNGVDDPSDPITPEATVAPPIVEAQAVVKQAGPVPFEAHKTALENARKKATDELRADFKQRYGGHLQLMEAMQADPVGTVTRLVTELQQHAEYGPALRSHAAKVLGGRRQEAEPQGDIDVQFSDGTAGRVYSEAAMTKRENWLVKRLEDRIGQQMAERFKPVEAIANRERAESDKRQYIAQAVDTYRPYVAELKEMPGFAANQDAIITRQKELFAEASQPGRGGRIDPMALVMRAYREIVPAKLQQQQQDSLAASAMAKAAGRSDNPASVAGSPPAPPRTMAEALRNAGVSF